jgi:hypothetical protein
MSQSLLLFQRRRTLTSKVCLGSPDSGIMTAMFKLGDLPTQPNPVEEKSQEVGKDVSMFRS